MRSFWLNSLFPFVYFQLALCIIMKHNIIIATSKLYISGFYRFDFTSRCPSGIYFRLVFSCFLSFLWFELVGFHFFNFRIKSFGSGFRIYCIFCFLVQMFSYFHNAIMLYFFWYVDLTKSHVFVHIKWVQFARICCISIITV